MSKDKDELYIKLRELSNFSWLTDVYNNQPEDLLKRTPSSLLQIGVFLLQEEWAHMTLTETRRQVVILSRHGCAEDP